MRTANIFVITLSMISLSFGGARADPQTSESFYEAVFPVGEHNTSRLLPLAESSPDFSNASTQKSYSWIYEYIGRNPKPYPPVITKWNKKIRIVLGVPSISPLSHETPKMSEIIERTKKNSAHHNELAKKEIEKQIPFFKKATGLDISYLGTAESEKTGNLIIAFVDEFSGGRKFKKNQKFSEWAEGYTYGSPDFFRNTFEPFFINQVKFSDIDQEEEVLQVDGYLLPDSQGNIQYAFCYISRKNTDVIVNALLKECMLRAMGLPGIVNTVEPTYLSAWNNHPQEEVAIPGEYTDLDKSTLKFLYSSQVKAGESLSDLKKQVEQIGK